MLVLHCVFSILRRRKQLFRGLQVHCFFVFNYVNNKKTKIPFGDLLSPH